MDREVKDVMTSNPECCTADWSLQKVAKLMVDCDCGAIPVVESLESKKPIGLITDRDIACRAVAEGKGVDTPVRECMTASTITVRENESVEDVLDLMEDKKVRRILVVDDQQRLCGIIAQADIAQHVSDEDVGEVVKEVTEKTDSPSAIH